MDSSNLILTEPVGPPSPLGQLEASKPESIPEEHLSISRLLQLKNVESPDMVSVQLNGVIVERSRFGDTSVSDHDELEFLYFMGGGRK